MYLQAHRKKWDSLHSDIRFRLKYPSEHVIRFVKSNFKLNQEGTEILDIGCGSGRHIVFLLQNGYCTYGIDISHESIEYTKKIVEENNYYADLRQASTTLLPFEENSFDGIICHGVLLYLKEEDIKVSISEIFRILKQGGKALIVVRSINDMRYGKGETVGNRTYRLTDNFTNELGMIIHFFTDDEIKELFSAFSDIQIGLSEMSMGSLEHYDSDYIIVVTK